MFDVHFVIFPIVCFLSRCQIASSRKHSKNKHKTIQGSGDGDDDEPDKSRTFMTEAS